MVDLDVIKARRDWRNGRDLSPFEIRLDDEHLAKHYATDVTALVEQVEQLRQFVADVKCALGPYGDTHQPEAQGNHCPEVVAQVVAAVGRLEANDGR